MSRKLLRNVQRFAVAEPTDAVETAGAWHRERSSLRASGTERPRRPTHPRPPAPHRANAPPSTSRIELPAPRRGQRARVPASKQPPCGRPLQRAGRRADDARSAPCGTRQRRARESLSLSLFRRSHAFGKAEFGRRTCSSLTFAISLAQPKVFASEITYN